MQLIEVMPNRKMRKLNSSMLAKGGNIPSLKVKSIRYFETNRGVGYQAKTNVPDVEILNDGTGGATYLSGSYSKTKDYQHLKDLSRAGLSIGFLIREAIHDFIAKTKK